MTHVTLLIFCVLHSSLPLALLFGTHFPGGMIMPGWQMFEANCYTMGRELPVPGLPRWLGRPHAGHGVGKALLSPASLSFSESRERLTLWVPSICASLLL